MAAAAVCINGEHRLLMVLQGKPDEEKSWSVPTGRLEPGESFEQCCVREVREETGYEVAVDRLIHTKLGGAIRYYEVALLGGVANISDPDNLIYEVAWVSLDQLEQLPMTYEEDRRFLIQHMSSSSS